MIHVALVILESLQIILIDGAFLAVAFFVRYKSKTYYYKWKDKRFRQQCYKEYEFLLQHKREQKLRKEEMEKYPLFYWKELTKEKK